MFGLFLGKESGESDDIGLDLLVRSGRMSRAVGAIGCHDFDASIVV